MACDIEIKANFNLTDQLVRYVLGRVVLGKKSRIRSSDGTLY